MEQVDFLVVGGGMVGAAVALGLAKIGKKVAIIERHSPKKYLKKQPIDLRVSAISPASVQLLKHLDVWSTIENMRICPYRRLETWESVGSRVRFNADAMALSELGFIVENRLIQYALWKACKKEKNITFYTDQGIRDILFDGEFHHIELDDGVCLSGRFLIGADGANSQVRDFANIGVTAWDYRHHCLLIHVETKTAEQDITWQWFTPTGPRSFLPLPEQQASLVWYDSPERIRQLSTLSNALLKKEIERHFPPELGEVEVIARGSFPLTRRHAQQYYRRNVVLVGDAAHTINPLAGQGVNLGFKDVRALLTLIENASDEAISDTLWQQYQAQRKPDNLLMQSTMDALYLGFSHQIPPLKWLRNFGFKMVEHTPILKHQMLKYALGIEH